MKKNNFSNIVDVFVIAVFVLIISVPFFGLWTPETKNTAEKRDLASMPKFNLHSKTLIKFPKAFEAYVNDHFKFREQLISLTSLLDKHLFDMTSSKQVIFGKHDWLFYTEDKSLEDIQRKSYFTADEKNAWEKNLLNRYDWFKKKNITYRFVLVPDKHSVYPEYLPSNVKINSRPSRWEDLLKNTNLSNQEFIIDLCPHFIKAKNNNANLYFKTDTHWTSYGAYIGYKQIMKSLSKPIPNIELNIIPMHSFTRDLANMAGIPTPEEDQVLAGDNFLSWQYAQALLPYNYSGGLRENYTLGQGVVATLCGKGEGTALVICDSYSEFFRPYLSTSFARVVYVWSFADNNTLASLVQQEKPNVVIEERAERYMHLVPTQDLQNALKIDTEKPENSLLAQPKLQMAYADLIQKKTELRSPTKGYEALIQNKEEYAKIFPENGGYVDIARQDGEFYFFKGWAGLVEENKQVDFVFIIRGDNVIFISECLIERPDVEALFKGLRYSGFQINIPKYLADSYNGSFRVFAMKDRKAYELTIINTEI